MAKLVVHKRAANYLRKLPSEQKEKVKASLRQLRDSPLTYPGNIKMTGKWAGYRRIRIGAWRVIYWADEQKMDALLRTRLRRADFALYFKLEAD